MSTKGVSTTAARTLIDRLVGAKVPVFCIRDFDVSGFTIAGTLRRGTRRYSWRSKGAIDLGLRLEDIQKYALESEDVYYRGANGRTLSDDQSIRLKIRDQLKANGATKEEIEFLLHHRVELNAFASDQLVEWIEEKLVEHGVEKVVPEEETLTKAVRGFARDLIAKRYLDTFAADIDREVDAAALALTGLAPAVLKMLEEDPALPWDKALARHRAGPYRAPTAAMNQLTEADLDRLVKLLGLLSSDQAGERATAGAMAWRFMRERKLTWGDVLRPRRLARLHFPPPAPAGAASPGNAWQSTQKLMP